MKKIVLLYNECTRVERPRASFLSRVLTVAALCVYTYKVREEGTGQTPVGDRLGISISHTNGKK